MPVKMRWAFKPTLIFLKIWFPRIQKSTGLSDDEDFEGSSEFSGDTDGEIFDQSDSQQTILKTTVQVSTEATTERLPITKDRYKDQTSLLPQEKKFVKSSEKMSSSAIQMVFSILSIVLVLLWYIAQHIYKNIHK